ncbi:MAG TPA: SDR family oxidoreductase [Sphingobium sp.]|nr:SDR family oxidoreductase [Sphingobium sp.]
MSGNLAGKVAIITGGGGGIGSATAERLARAGAAVAVADLFLDAAEAAAEKLRAEGLQAKAFKTDMASEEEINALVAGTVEAFGRVDILHNNAVLNDPVIYPQDTTLADMNVEHWDKIFAVNIRGPMLLSKAVIPHMIAAGGGAIVNMSSGASTKGLPDMLTAYGASKGALNTLTLYSAVQLGKHNIRVNALVCGAILTPSLQKLFTKEQVEAMEKVNLLGRSTFATDVAALVHFLVSEDARQITGQLYPI